MPKINWLDKLSDEQVVYADMIAQKAKELGVPSELALAVAYHESGLNPRKIGSAKEIGIMQVLPSTGRGLGYTPGDLHDPAKNIEAGIKYLKSHLDAYGSPEIAAFAYNRGPNVANKFIAGEDDQAGQNYVKSVQGLGGFSGTVQVEEPMPEIEAEMRAMQKTAAPEAEQQAQKMAGLMGAGAGAAVGAKRAIGPVIAQKAGDVAQYLGQRSAMGQMAAQQAAGLPPQGTPPIYTGEQTGRLLGGTTDEMGTTGRARMESFNTLTAQQAAARRAAAPGLQQLAQQGVIAPPEQYFARQPTQVASPGGILIPAQAAQQMQTAAKAVPSGLEQISQTFRGMMAPTARLATRILAPLGLYSTGAEGVATAQELARPEPDYAAAAAGGVGALGGALSLFPPTAPIGVPMAIAGPMVREELQQTRERAIPPQQIQQMLSGPRQPEMSGMIRGLGR